MILPVERLLCLEVAVPVGKVEEPEGDGKEDARHRVNLGRAVRRAGARGGLLTRTPVVLEDKA